jgi:hypothetical protein
MISIPMQAYPSTSDCPSLLCDVLALNIQVFGHPTLSSLLLASALFPISTTTAVGAQPSPVLQLTRMLDSYTQQPRKCSKTLPSNHKKC